MSQKSNENKSTKLVHSVNAFQHVHYTFKLLCDTTIALNFDNMLKLFELSIRKMFVSFMMACLLFIMKTFETSN